MTRNLYVWGILMALILLAAGATWGQIASAAGPARALETSSAGQRPVLAVIGSVDETATRTDAQNPQPVGQSHEDLEDLLVAEIGNQPFLKLVDRKSLDAVMEEHAIAISNLGDANKAAALGKFAGADYLLHVVVMKETASARLVETATGQVKLDEEIKLNADLALFAAAIREKVLAVLRPESKVTNYLTVGITEFPNRSGNPMSDKLGLELQKTLRKRLTNQSWAVVLERQYPTALLEEVDLARMGFTRSKATDSLPPADFVILGSLEDLGREYEPGKPWQVMLHLTLRLRGRVSQIDKKFRSDAVDAAADDLQREIDEFRRQKPLSETNVPEKELWRRQALYLMPRPGETWADAIVPNFPSKGVLKLETLRAWENVLLLDSDDPEAMTYLGVCLIGFNRRMDGEAENAQSIAGSHLVERAFRGHPTNARADTYLACIGALSDTAPARAKEMAQYVVENPKQFKHGAVYWVKKAMNTPVAEKGGEADAQRAIWQRVIQNAELDPDSLLLAFSPTPGGKPFELEQAATFLEAYVDSPDAVIQFVAHKVIGEQLALKKKDPAGLEHFDKAIEVMERAYQRCERYSRLSSDVYRRRIEACILLGRPDEAKTTALAGMKYFLEAARFDDSIAWLYYYGLTEVLGEGQEKESLAICDAHLAAVKKKYWADREFWPRIAAKREELLAKLAGKRAPDMSGLRLANGTAGTNIKFIRLAAAGGRVWLVSGNFYTRGKALLYRPDRDEVVQLPSVPYEANCVAVLNDSVFFGTDNGLYKLDADGKLLKHYDQKNAALPSDRIWDVCEGDGEIYFAFGGVAVLDPLSDKITVLSPSNREVKGGVEPRGVERLRWDAATPRLFACGYQYLYFNFPMLTSEFHLSINDKTWKPYPIKKAPCMVVSNGEETLLARDVEEQTEFQFLKSGKKLKAAVPVPQMIGEPAWDENRIWVPTASGLYEVDRETGRVSWLAYQDGNTFYSVLKHGDRLYVATSRGLYYREISLATANKFTPESSPNASAAD